MRLLLIRHGQTPSNVGRLLDTTMPGPGLTELGVRQAAVLAEELAGERIDAIYASPMTRARLTAAPLAAARGLTVLVRDGIREISAGVYEMRGDREAVDAYLSTTFAWTRRDMEPRISGGESGGEVLARFDAVVAEAAGSGAGTVAMVSHGAMIRTWAGARGENLDADFGPRHYLDNTARVLLEGTPETGWKVLAWTGATIPAPAAEDSGPAGQAVSGG